MSRDVLDVAIVGGGVSGCYCGYRLLTADRTLPALRSLSRASGGDTLSVALYESSDRIGGRLWSYRFPELPDVVADLGGMCFSPLHANVYNLCKNHLRLETEEADEFSVYNLQHIRNHRYAFCDYCPPEKDRSDSFYPRSVPYFLSEQEKWRYPTDLMLGAFKKATPAVAPLLDALKKEGEEPAKARRIIEQLKLELQKAHDAGSGLPLHDCGFWSLLSRHASQEAYDMATSSSGFYSTTQNWNAYDTLLGAFVDFSVPQTWTKLKEGYDALPRELAQRFVGHGGEVHTRTRLRGLEVQGEGAEAVITMRLEANGYVRTQQARNVILAMPQRSVRLLDPDSFLFRNGQFVEDLGAVTCEPASKLFLAFAEPWWRKVQAAPNPFAPTIRSGQSATDLPLRLCYYLGSEENGKSLLLASFTDSIGVEYWNGYLPRGRPNPLVIDPPPEMVQDAVRQLRAMHDFPVPEPLAAVFAHWGADPYGGGYHFWNTHVRSWEVMPRIRRPSPGANVFLCGEAYSAKQGWVEGAINTAEMTLETGFGLPRPSWTPEDYDFGP